MLKTLKILPIVLLLLSCYNRSEKEVIHPKQIDSLLHFDSIQAIYTHAELPPFITDNTIEKGESKPSLHTDSMNRWTNAKTIIDSVYKLFPYTKKHTGVIEIVCCGNRDLLIATTKGHFKISWNINTSDSAVFFDTIPYTMDKKKLNTIYQLPDRKIITKEVFLKDTVNYAAKNIYTTRFGAQRSETRFIYILK